MKTLFIDSSRKSLSIALASQNKLLFVSNVNSYSKHSNYLLNEIKNILTKLNININDIDNYVVLNGPGSFTGIRVGITVAKILAWTLSKKLYVINNLKALSLESEDEVIVSIIPDKKDFSYVGIYSKDNVIEDYVNINDPILNFNGKSITLVTMEENDYVTRLSNMLSLNNKVNIKIINDYNYLNLINYALSKNNINPHSAKPIYLKKIDAEKKNEN